MITRRERKLQSIRDNHVQIKLMLPRLRETLKTGEAAYDKLLDTVEQEDELREAQQQSPEPIPDIDKHLAKLAVSLQWIRRLIQDIESV